MSLPGIVFIKNRVFNTGLNCFAIKDVEIRGTMAESGLVSDNSAASVEYEAVKGVNLKKYDRFKHLLSWDEKQSLF